MKLFGKIFLTLIALMPGSAFSESCTPPFDGDVRRVRVIDVGEMNRAGSLKKALSELDSAKCIEFQYYRGDARIGKLIAEPGKGLNGFFIESEIEGKKPLEFDSILRISELRIGKKEARPNKPMESNSNLGAIAVIGGAFLLCGLLVIFISQSNFPGGK